MCEPHHRDAMKEQVFRITAAHRLHGYAAEGPFADPEAFFDGRAATDC